MSPPTFRGWRLFFDLVAPITVDKLVLNRNPVNYFAEVEQAAFCPGNVVPGIAISPDKMLQALRVSLPLR